MKMTIKVEGCPYEDREELRQFSCVSDIAQKNCEAREMISKRLNTTDVSKEEEKFLEALRELLWWE